jgi:YfiH family protein
MSAPDAPPNSAAIVRPDWPAPARVHAFATTRQLPGLSQPPYDAFNLGARSGEDPATVAANRALLQRAFALPAPPRWLHQVHGDRSLRITEEILDGEPEGDAAFTRQPGTVLAILTADCLPLLLCSRDGREIAAIHAGWRGLSAGVIENCLRRLATDPADLLAWIGPAIGAASYEIGGEVRDAFVRTDEGAAEAFAPTRPGHWHCDLPRLARRRLAARGVHNVHGGDFDTLGDARFYSYRRDGARSGRFASLIWIDA